MNNLFYALALIFVTGVSFASGNEGVSIYQLLGNPAQFNGKNIVVTGVLGVLDGGEVALFPDTESRENQVTVNAIELAGEFSEGSVGPRSKVTVAEMDGKYVMVWGVYCYSKPGNRLYTGAFCKVSELRLHTKLPAHSIPAPDAP